MRRLVMCLLFTCTTGSLSAQRLVHEWDFSKGLAEWFSAHSVSPLRLENGCMLLQVVGPDPYVHCSKGDVLDIAGKPTQFVRIRLRSTTEGTAEFFWAGTTAGQDAGFVGGKEIGFPVAGGMEWRDVDVYPGWEEHITRLRLDPPGNDAETTLWVSRIAIYEWPESRQHGPVWDLVGDHANWLPKGETSMDYTPEGACLSGDRPEVSTRLQCPLPATPWLTVHARTPHSEGWLLVSWRDSAGRARRSRQRLSTARDRYVLSFADDGAPPAQGESIRLTFIFDPGPGTVVLQRITLADTPVGEAMLDVLTSGTDRASAATGEDVEFTAQLQNSGGQELAPGVLRLWRQTDAEEAPFAQIPFPALAPGSRTTAAGRLTFDVPGTVELSVGRRDGPLVHRVAVSTPPGPTPPPGASITPDTASLVGANTRLRAGIGSADGSRYGPLWLELRDGQEWRRVATLPAIGMVSGMFDAGADQTGGLGVPFSSGAGLDAATAVAADGELSFRHDERDANGELVWSAEATYRVDGDDCLSAEYALTVGRNGRLLHFSGPWMRVGDGTAGARKHEALFPGIEYLGSDVAGDEASSSDRDVATPLAERFVPDRHNITIPLQAVALPNGDLAALLWKHGEDGSGPAAVFASPNFIEAGHPRTPERLRRSGANHLLGLFLPAVPEHVKPNELLASTPRELSAGETVTIRTTILARPKAEVLDAVRVWIARNGPQAAGRVRDLLDQTLRLSRTALESVLWRPGRGWVSIHSKDNASLSPAVAVLYRYLAAMLSEPDLLRLAQERLPATTSLGLALHQGNVADALQAAHRAAQGPLGRRRPDGTWGFEPDEAREVLGEKGDTNIGIMAPMVAAILAGARAGADEKLLAEGLQALQHLRKYRVPRGAQVWEVPLHAPDILASGRACDAFRLAFELTGDRRHLEDARYWAATALPFIYHWQHPRPDLAPMRGGSIPIFGSSFFTNLWYGRLVQWNGLAVAGSLHALARAGGGEEWAQVAEDLTVSGQRQQISDPDSDIIGLYPDFWNMRTGIPGYWLSPSLLLTTVLQRCGHTPNGDWAMVRAGGKLISIVSPTPLRGLQAGETRLGTVVRDVSAPCSLAFEADYDLGPHSFVALVGVARPGSISIAGRTVPSVENVDAVAQGWEYAPDVPAVVLKMDHSKQERVAVRVVGLEPADPAPPERPEWTFRRGLGGWGAAPHDVTVTREAGRLVAKATGPDPYFSGPILNLPCAVVSHIEIRIRVSHAGTCQLFWAGDQGGYSPARSLSTPAIPADGAFHQVRVESGTHPKWRGTLTQLRLDPPGQTGATSEIEWIRLTP